MEPTLKIEAPDDYLASFIALRVTDESRNEIVALHWGGGDGAVRDTVTAWCRGPGTEVAMSERGPAALFKVIEHRPNVVSVGLIATDLLPDIALPFTRFVRDGLFKELKAHGAHRIECMSLASNVQTHKWIRMFGMAKEGEHPKFGKAGETFFTFAWTAL